MNDEKIREHVKESYGKIAGSRGVDGSPETDCGCSCGCGPTTATGTVSEQLGYTKNDLGEIPEGADMGLGCGNPVALASLKEGETVLDLGSGAGIDAFIAANRVGKDGRVIGVDMTPEMLERANENALKGGYENVEFRQGYIEDLPVEDGIVDAIISNCVINLSTDKPKVYREAYRVLKDGGRVMVSDIVLTKELPKPLQSSIQLYTGCVAGALLKDDYIQAVKDAGFTKVEVVGETHIPSELWGNDPEGKKIIDSLNLPNEELEDAFGSIVSIKLQAFK